MVSALPFFLLMVFFSERKCKQVALHHKDWQAMILLGVGGYYLASLLDFLGLQYVSAGLERLVLFLYPTITVLITAFILKQPIRRITWAAIAVSYIGMALVMLDDIGHTSEHLIWGVLLVFGGAVSYAAYLVGSGEMIKRIGATRFTGITLSIACLCSLIHFVISAPENALVLSSRIWLLGLVLGIFCTVIPATLLTNGIRRIGASQAALIGAVGPVSTLYLGYAVLDEKLTWLQSAGTAFILIGILMITVKREKTSAA
jgi:drug/metabolite transporter (DMT)-like permease